MSDDLKKTSEEMKAWKKEFEKKRPDIAEKVKARRASKQHRISIVFPEKMLEVIKELALQEDIPYQTYIKDVLKIHIDKKVS